MLRFVFIFFADVYTFKYTSNSDLWPVLRKLQPEHGIAKRCCWSFNSKRCVAMPRTYDLLCGCS